MRFSAVVLLGAAGLAAAQSSTSASSAAAPSSSGSPSGCGSAVDAIINACLGTELPLVKACAANHWSCMCSAQQQVVACYQNCPSDPNAFGAQQQETSWCNAAKAYSSTSTTARGGAATTAAIVSTMSSSTKTTPAVHTGFASASGTAASSSTPTGAASGFSPAGGLVAAIFGLALL